MGISNIPVAPKALIRTSLRPSATAVSRSGTLIRAHTYEEQSRAFRIGSWSAWEDASPEELRRRQQIAKEKYIESLNKRLSWNRYSPIPHRHIGLKSFMWAWRTQGGSAGQHWYIDESGNIKSKNPKENGKENEDVEHNPSGKLWRYENHKSMFTNPRSKIFGDDRRSTSTTENIPQPPRASSTSTPNSPITRKDYYQGSQSPHYEVESEIDPITNRRVVKNPSVRPKNSATESTNIPVKTFKGYQSQFQNFGPPENQYKASQSSGTVEEGLKDYDGKVDYEAHKLYDPAESRIDYSDPIQGGLKAYDEKIATKPLTSTPDQENQSTQQRDPNETINKRKHLEAVIDPIEKAIGEYETQEEHPEISQQVRDQHLQARRNMKRAAERHDAGIGQHSKSQHTDHLFESIQEYNMSPPNTEAQSSIPDPIQEGLEAYDNKADYDPKHHVDFPVKHTDYPGQVKTQGAEWDVESSWKDDHYDASSRSNYAKSLALKDISEDEVGDRTRKQLEVEFENERRLSPSEEAAAVEKVKNSPKLIQELKIETSELQNHVAHARGRIDAKIAEVEAGWVKPDESKKLTGNFVRDFPEEFEDSWSQNESGSGSLIPKTRSERQIELDVQEGERSYVDGLFARDSSTPRLETALDRSGSGKPKRTNDKTLIREVRKIYEDSYGTIDSKHRQIKENKNTNQTENTSGFADAEKTAPILYKILAYDPTMQSISTAETTSIVPDSATPLTPAEVLLRLSNPAKFFPHFQPLQSQGFEIVSGSGDVLVFRKVRSGAPPVINIGETSSAQQRMRSTNPIDGMSVPIAATGDFASPTGFVNHDIHRGSEPAFKSNIDVRREEPVFSGKKNWQDSNDTPKPKRMGKRILVGAAWVAACSYAVGVVADFFKTGGLDGTGLQGF